MADEAKSKTGAAIEFARQADRLAHLTKDQEDETTGSTAAVEAKFITPQDPVVETANGGRLPAVPIPEAQKLNMLKDKVEGCGSAAFACAPGGLEEETHHENVNRVNRAQTASDEEDDGFRQSLRDATSLRSFEEPDAPLRQAMPASRTNPLFPPLPMYGPPTLLRNLQCWGFRVTSSILSLAFLGVIVLGSAFTSIPLMFRHIGIRLTLGNPDARRPFYREEQRRKEVRKEAARAWERRRRNSEKKLNDDSEDNAGCDDFVPSEGGRDPLVCDVAYYARRVGLDVEEFKVQTEDGFIIELWHVYDPKEYKPVPLQQRRQKTAEVFTADSVEDGRRHGASGSQQHDGNRKYPVLLIHGLLQSAGAYCCNDDDSLAFFLCKSGYDVWLGNNRCGFKPEHQMLHYGDPRMWAWNIRQMGVMDLPAHVSRVLLETGFAKLGLVCHSQGTTQTFVALAKEQRPDLGQKISVFCALAPAAYAGSLIGKMYFKFMRIISPAMFRIFFGIHAFIPFMMTMHAILPGKLYGALGYRVFSFLFNWTDDRWDQGLRDRQFQFAPVYVSAESMRWWLGRECFAKQKCILATKEEGKQEDVEDEEEDYYCNDSAYPAEGNGKTSNSSQEDQSLKGQTAWYDEQVPPMAFWIAGSDALVDGRRLLRRFERGREPHVNLVHSKIIEEYEHLDVIWALDSIEQVGKEVKDVLWKTASIEAREMCRVPRNCEELDLGTPDSASTAVDHSGVAT
ncbi:MAG: hypothetical protein M1812_001569 [Candelaria pacifica]|nr:MAG: hypothetical protein M1812_001569 [Candelaria pacifica]